MKSSNKTKLFFCLIILSASALLVCVLNLPSSEFDKELPVGMVTAEKEILKDILNNKELPDKTIVKTLSEIKDKFYHEKMGAQLYNYALSKGFYSKQKIGFLRVAKTHLLLAKNN